MKVIQAIKKMANEYNVSLTSKQLEKLVKRYRKDKLTYGKTAAVMLLREYFSILV